MQQLTIELSDDVYQPLAAKAQAMGKTVEALTLELLENSVGVNPPGSRLRRWAGAFDSDVPDAATRHHDYLGQALHDELQEKRDA